MDDYGNSLGLYYDSARDKFCRSWVIFHFLWIHRDGRVPSRSVSRVHQYQMARRPPLIMSDPNLAPESADSIKFKLVIIETEEGLMKFFGLDEEEYKKACEFFGVSYEQIIRP